MGAGASQSDIILKKSLIEKKLEETGEKARLEEYLRARLIECGWKEDLKKHCLGKFDLREFLYQQTLFFSFQQKLSGKRD